MHTLAFGVSLYLYCVCVCVCVNMYVCVFFVCLHACVVTYACISYKTDFLIKANYIFCIVFCIESHSLCQESFNRE